MSYTLPSLTYAYDALEPYIDAQTMGIHHTKHHLGYIAKFNAIVDKYPSLQGKSPEEILQNLSEFDLEKADRQNLINNSGGVANHSLFWQVMGPAKQIDEELVSEIEKSFFSLEAFKKEFSDIATTRFGSGWTWLARGDDGSLKVYATSNQDSPYLKGDTPIICLDVWEHAYYLKYQNRRSEYIENWWQVLKLLS